MSNLIVEMNKLDEHFVDKKEKKEPTQDWSAFKTYNVGGRQVIDLTSIDCEYSRPQMIGEDIERQRIYGSDAWNPNRM